MEFSDYLHILSLSPCNWHGISPVDGSLMQKHKGVLTVLDSVPIVIPINSSTNDNTNSIRHPNSKSKSNCESNTSNDQSILDISVHGLYLNMYSIDDLNNGTYIFEKIFIQALATQKHDHSLFCVF